MKHELPKLSFAQDALAPTMSAETMAYHYGKHLQTYLDQVNGLTEGTPFAEMTLKEIIGTADGPLYNAAAQAWNHILFFKQLTPHPVTMSPTMSQAINARFGSIEAFRSAFNKAATTLFGSGWVWLALDKQHELQIVVSPNAGNPITQGMRPLFCIDVWEHAYYLDYQNRRAEYVENFWKLIDWNKVEKRMTLEESLPYF